MGKYPKQLLVGIDQLLNTVLGGYADETISSRCWRHSADVGTRWYYARKVVDWVALHIFGEKDHCLDSFTDERLRTQYPPEVREQFEKEGA